MCQLVDMNQLCVNYPTVDIGQLCVNYPTVDFSIVVNYILADVLLADTWSYVSIFVLYTVLYSQFVHYVVS